MAATATKTIDKLHYFETLYHNGYQSDIIDQSLEKIVALECAEAKHELQELSARLESYERQYQMKSEEFYQKFQIGELGDSADVFEWSVFYDMWQAVKERFEVLSSLSR